MSRISANAREKTPQFHAYVNEAIGMNETNDCAVRALAAISELSYKEAHALLAAEGRRPRRGTEMFKVEKALQSLGFIVEQLPINAITSLFPGTHKHLQSVTPHHPVRFAKVWPAGRFILASRQHCCAVIDGMVHDWARGHALRCPYILKVTLPTGA